MAGKVEYVPYKRKELREFEWFLEDQRKRMASALKQGEKRIKERVEAIGQDPKSLRAQSLLSEGQWVSKGITGGAGSGRRVVEE